MSKLITKHLIKTYRKRRVVNDVNIELIPGEIVGLLGPNGAGKTTTFKMVVGLTKPDTGQIFLGDKEISNLAMYKRAQLGIGYLPQERTIFARLTVAQNIMAILETLKINSKERRARLEKLLEDMDLKHLRDSKAGNLSGGEKRRLEITRSLVTNPTFIMLDEPFAAVDPKLVEGLQKIILNLKKIGIGILITDHKPRETLSITDRSYIIHEGQVLIHGTSEELVNNERVRQLYLGQKFIMPEYTMEYAERDKGLAKVHQLASQNNLIEAVQGLTAILSFYPNDAELYFHRGVYFFKLGDKNSAQVDFTRSLTLNPDYEEARRYLNSIEISFQNR